jgi:putative transposase
MRRCKSTEHAQRFLAPFGPIRDHFCPGRHRLAAAHYRRTMADRFSTWRAVTGLAA